jgi:tetratricopeptide (TPR) repeat protein
MNRLVGLALLLSLCSYRCPCAFADDSFDTSSAQAWFEQGLSLSRAQHWQAARSAFLKSLELEPHVSTYFNLAVASLKLELGRAALLALEDFARTADPQAHTDFLSQSAILRARASALTGSLELTVQPAAEVHVDDETRSLSSSVLHIIRLDPGLHVLRLQAAGFSAERREVQIAIGQSLQERIELAAIQPALPPPVAVVASPDKAHLLAVKPVSSPTEPVRWKKPLLWASAGVVLVAAAVTTGLVLRKRNEPSRMPYAGSSGIRFEAQ